MTRWWGVALLALSVGLNAGLGVAVLQQRFLPAPQAPAAEPPAPYEAPAGWIGSVPAESTYGGEGAPPASSGSPDAAASDRPAAPAVGDRSAASAAAPEPARTAAAAEEPAHRDGEGATEAAPASDELAWMAPDEADAGPPPAAGPPRRPLDRPLAMPPAARLEEMAERLGVPPADRSRFAELQRRFFGETRDGRMRLDGVRRQLRAELTAGEPDRARIDALLSQSSELQAGLERALVEHVLAARELLDGEAERRYLHFLSRLGAGGGPGAGPGPGMRRRPLRDRPGPGRRPPF